MNARLLVGNIFWCIIKRFPFRLIVCDLSLSEIPVSTMFPHPIGITIKLGTRFGDHCIIYQNVTIGDRGGHHIPTQCAIIGDNVRICVGSIILGGVRIGNNVTIGAGSIVLDDICDNTTYVNRIIPHLIPKRNEHETKTVEG